MLDYCHIFDRFHEGFASWTPEGRLLQANAAFRRLMELKAEESFSDIPDATHLSHVFFELVGAVMRQAELLGVVKNYEMRLSHDNGAAYWVKVDAWRILDADGKIRCYAAILSDVTSLKLKDAELSRLTFYDSLTGLPNRALLLEKLSAALLAAKRYPEQYALIHIDLDDMRNINQHYGRNFGDMLLRHVTATLLACCRETDAVARVGSDDFVMLLRDPQGGSQVVKIIKRIRAKLEVPFAVWGQQLDMIPANFGVIFPLRDYDKPEFVLRDAALAAEASKASRNSHALKFFSKKMIEKVRKTLSLVGVLQKKRDLHGFNVVYQPIIRSENLTLHSFEALARWTHGGKAVPPSTFIPIAEETGLIKNLGDFVIDAACRQLRRWQDEYDADIDMHVNISPQQLVAHGFPDKVHTILSHTGIDVSRLYFEVTESIFLRDFSKVLHNINLLRQCGVHFCLDDFGIGYSSLNYLQQLPIDRLKLDRSLVHDLEKNATSRLLLKHVIALSSDMGYRLVVEGVERRTQLLLLGDVKRLLLQGFYFYKPLSLYEANGLLDEVHR
jgi:diguanylate cyclase (GGDEF)-like protein/PAS domain S-box-containing protein